MPVYVKTVTFDCTDAMVVARFWAAALGTDVDGESTSDRAYVEAPGWGGPNMWFIRVPESKTGLRRRWNGLRLDRHTAPLLRGHVPDGLGELPLVTCQILDSALPLAVHVLDGLLKHPSAA